MHVEVLVVGAGLSGVCAAHYLQRAGRDFAVVEARPQLGGTWDLFRYPGIRSDSDMHTLGFRFHPWPNPQAIADGPAILQYLNDTVDHFGLRPCIHFGRRVVRAQWSSEDGRWTVTLASGEDGAAAETWTCRFLWACTGYYRYDRGHSPSWPDQERFGGRIVHPQHWPEDLDYSDQQVIVIGSGATAVTLVPAMAETAAHVTMLQRSPTYVLSLARVDRVSLAARRLLGERLGAGFTRWKNVLRAMAFFKLSRSRPQLVRRYLLDEARQKMPEVDVDTHFSPTYDPWDQRVCFVPDDDLFDALNSGRASVVTDQIERFTEHGIALASGRELAAELVVTATGLELQALGGAAVEVDGVAMDLGERLLYKGTMLSGVPNAAISVGYTNASWTLKCELIAEYIPRLLDHMDARGATQVWPEPGEDVGVAPLIDFNSGYVKRAENRLPKQGDRRPWRLYQNYVLDLFSLRHAAIETEGLRFR
jgi:cation diffusion facilitator CzcD-associated flavoprotein CzcO